MSDLLVSILLAVCPMPDAVETTECHERILNCAVQEAGKIDEKTIKECVDKHIKESENGNINNVN